MPVSTATAERSFSKMRRVKTYLRNNMTTERLSGLGLLNIYQDHEINAEQVVDVFCLSQRASACLNFQGLKISIKLMISITEPNIALKTKQRHKENNDRSLVMEIALGILCKFETDLFVAMYSL